MSMANPCPCELIVNESLSNSPPVPITGSTLNDITDAKSLEDYLDQLAGASQTETSSEFYPLIRQTKSIDMTRERVKRPSWAAIGKRALSFYDRQRPSWAQVG